MMPTMMFGMETSPFFLIVPVTLVLVCLLIMSACTWLVARWLKKQRSPLMQDTPQPRDEYEGYEPGYPLQSQPVEFYQKDGQRYLYPQDEYPHTQYQEMEQLRH